jgi:hypothetical protein
MAIRVAVVCVSHSRALSRFWQVDLARAARSTANRAENGTVPIGTGKWALMRG